MSQHARTDGGTRSATALWQNALAWHDRRPRATMSSPRGWIWAGLLAASLFWMSNPLVFVREFGDSVSSTITWTAVAVVVTLPWLRVPRVPWPWVLFLALCVLSQAWTISASSTDDSIVLYVKFTALACVAAAQCKADVVAWGMGLGGVVVVVLSIYAYDKTMWGSSYLTWQGNIFAGVGTNENILAYTLAISTAATLAVLRRRRLPAQACWMAVLTVNGYGFYLAKSGTGYLTLCALVTTLISITVWPMLRTAGRRVGVLWASTAGLLLVLSLVAVASLLDKQVSTVSGRSPFWIATFEATMDRAPLLGSGWGAVWGHPWDPAPPNPVADVIYQKADLWLAHGHNFFVDVLPELGLAGVTVALLVVVHAVGQVRRCGLQAGAADPITGRLVLFVLVALLVSGVSEPMLTVPIGWWSLALVTSLPAHRAVRRHEEGREEAAPATELREEPAHS